MSTTAPQMVDVSSLAGSMAFAALKEQQQGYIPQAVPVAYGVTATGKRIGAPYIVYGAPEPAGTTMKAHQAYSGPSKRTSQKRAARHGK